MDAWNGMDKLYYDTQGLKEKIKILEEDNKVLKSALEDAYTYKNRYYEIKSDRINLLILLENTKIIGSLPCKYESTVLLYKALKDEVASFRLKIYGRDKDEYTGG
jgi:hypothetical protein